MLQLIQFLSRYSVHINQSVLIPLLIYSYILGLDESSPPICRTRQINQVARLSLSAQNKQFIATRAILKRLLAIRRAAQTSRKRNFR